MITRPIRMRSRAARILSLGLILALAAASPAAAGLIFYTSMDTSSDITNPSVNQATYATTAEAIPGPTYFSFVTGKYGSAAQIDNTGGPWNGPIHFPGANFDFADPGQDGGRLDVWMRFDEDPHAKWGPWTLRSNWPGRRINLEITNGDMMFDVYGEVAHNERTNYGQFRVRPVGNPTWNAVAAGEWHLYTFLWRNNGGVHRDEIHYYIDGTLIGSDFNGNLPTQEQFTDLFVSPLNDTNKINFTLDEMYSFDSWDVSGATGNFANIVFPESVVPTYPMDKRSPVWASAVTLTNRPSFEFEVFHNTLSQCNCDLYIDGSLAGSTVATNQAMSSIAAPSALANGPHSYQIKCDNDRLVSPVVEFDLNYSGGTATDAPSVGQWKARY